MFNLHVRKTENRQKEKEKKEKNDKKICRM